MKAPLGIGFRFFGIRAVGRTIIAAGLIAGLLVAPGRSVGTVCAAEPTLGQQERRTVLIGLVNNNEPGFRSEVLNPTLHYLQETLPKYVFRTVDIAAYKASDDLRRTRPDFVIAPSDLFLTLSLSMGSHPLAVRKSSFAIDANRSMGSAVVVLKSRDDINNLQDLRGKTVSASLPDSLGGWLALSAEFAAMGVDPERFFRRISFETFQIPEVVGDVLSARSDAGVLSTCQLEVAEQRGLIAAGELKVIGRKHTEGFACAHSTELYPDQIFGSVSQNVPPDMLKEISVALLQMPEGWGRSAGSAGSEGFSWQVAGRFDAVSRLLHTLKIGPYAYLQDWTIEGIFKRFSTEILAALAVLAFLALNEIRLLRLVRARTEKLNRLVEEKGRMLEEVRSLSSRLHTMERNSLVSQMSSIIAHELKQPLGAIINYCAVINMTLESRNSDESQLIEVNDAVNREAHRIRRIVDRVRSYVKKSSGTHKPCVLDDLVRRAHASFAHYSESTPNVALDLAAGSAQISAEDLEVEILILNLMKNAGRAVAKVDDGRIVVRTFCAGATVALEVIDNGPRLSDEEMQKLNDVSDSTSAEGLGLGLPIVRSIVDAHSAQLQIERAAARGVCMRVVFEQLEGNEHGPQQVRADKEAQG